MELLDPSTREYGWVATVIETVSARTGISSGWNGEVWLAAEELEQRNSSGRVMSDGALQVHPGLTLDPLRKAYDNDRLSPGELQATIDAAGVVTHESMHLLTRSGPGVYFAPDHAIEEYLADLGTTQEIRHVVGELGLTEQHPGLRELSIQVAYPATELALDPVTRYLADNDERKLPEIHDRLRTATLTQRCRTLAELAVERKLGAHPHAPDVLVPRLEALQRPAIAGLVELDTTPGLDPETVRTKATEAGTAAIGAIEGLVDEAEGRKEPPFVGIQYDESGLGWDPDQQRWVSAAGGGELDTGHLRKFLGGLRRPRRGPETDQGTSGETRPAHQRRGSRGQSIE
ncbi:hypothetical protein FB561_3235 [Kribbella amoyensis]|uniref:Uncharacterized protein n=1 Tax=Kribbella amoyensis TaxID=996641 RepID=A0A561BTD5_9ACTN|nr:hypothetical protein [Kribbella amoyensis]TWD82108.1 hypothetical protein FB561_3235 [Kribbella amoyensis]